MRLEYIFHNVKITYGYQTDKKNGINPVLIVENVDFINNQDFNNRKSCKEFSFNRDSYIMETDFILVRSEDEIKFIESFEFKSSKNKSPYDYNVQRQLLKQAIILGATVMKDIIINIKNECFYKNLFEKNKYLILNVKYLNGAQERNIKETSLKDRIRYIFRNGYLISNIFIEKKDFDLNFKFYFVFDKFIYTDSFTIPINNLDLYLNVIFKNYNKIVDNFLNTNKKIIKKELKSLLDIIDEFFKSQNSFQDQE